MVTREMLVEVFKDTMDMIDSDKELQECVEKSVAGTKFYAFDEAYDFKDVSYNDQCSVSVSRNRTFEEVFALQNEFAGRRICVLNFASATSPGGGVKNGSKAQEESLCRCSTLYPVLKTGELWENYYNFNRYRDDARYTDSCIYTPDIRIIKSDTAVPERLGKEQQLTADVITCAAPNLRHMHISDEELFDIHEKRARRILDVAADNGVEVIVLGAFGCGAFRNNPAVVAKAYRKVVEEYRQRFIHISFAIYSSYKDRGNYDVFRAYLAEGGDDEEKEVLLRQRENDEIIRHLEAVKKIIGKKCRHCPNAPECIGCIFSRGEMVGRIDDCLEMMYVFGGAEASRKDCNL